MISMLQYSGLLYIIQYKKIKKVMKEIYGARK